MKSPWILAALLPGMSLPMHGLQAKTPQAALEEIVTADKPEVIARHLPEAVQKSIDDLPKPRKQQVLDELLSTKSEHLDGCTVRRANDADSWELIDANGESAGRVKLGSVFISGLDALVSVELESEDGSRMFIVAMHLEGDDWRIGDFGRWAKTDLHLRQLLHQPSESEKNEATARESIHRMMTALYRYAQQYPRIGFPFRLGSLVGRAGQEPSPEHAGFLDDSFAAEPLVLNGYEFVYTLTRRGGGSVWPEALGGREAFDMGVFQIIATPVEFGKTGSKNYFANQIGEINVTSENRPANQDDPAADDDPAPDNN